MQEIHISKYQSIFFDFNSKILYELWNSATQQMSDVEFIFEMEQQVLACTETMPCCVLSNIQFLKYAVSVEMQVWISDVIFTQFINLGVKRIAFVVPNDLIIQLSYEQAMDENLGKKFQSKFFDTEEQALDWLQKTDCICNDTLCTCASN